MTDNRRESAALDDATRRARDQVRSFDSSIAGLQLTTDKRPRTARMTVLTSHPPGEQPYNLFTLVRHRRKSALGPWSGEPSGTWFSTDLGCELRLFSIDSSLEHCHAMVYRILDGGTLEIDGLRIHYALEPVPRQHWAYRDDRQLADSAMRSPFSNHSAKIDEYWSLASAPLKRWLDILESHSINFRVQPPRLGFPLDRNSERVGNLMIAGAEDAITCDLTVNRAQTLRFHVDANELLPGTYRATVWASHSDDNVLRREIAVTPGLTAIELASDVDRIGFAIHRSIDGQCTDMMEEFLIMEVSGRIEIDSGPTLLLKDRQQHTFHKVKPPGPISEIKIQSDKGSTKLDKSIRQLCLDRRIRVLEAATRQQGNFVRFRPDEFDQANRYFVNLLRGDSDQVTPIYLADPYFMNQLEGTETQKLYIDMFAATTHQPLRILCTAKEHYNNVLPWWSKYPKQITAHVDVRAILEHNGQKRAFHDRYLITPKREILITHSINGWRKDGVTFASIPYNVYRAEAEWLWSMEIGSETTDFFVQEIR